MVLQPGRKLGHYEIVGKLGAGGMGVVYRARDTRLGREVALKVLSDRAGLGDDQRSRFRREAQTISSLNHPHICTLHDVGEVDGIDFLVMELVDGRTLAERLGEGALPVAELLALADQILSALAAAHQAGLVHRDLKPGNLMLTATGIKLLDFGLARTAAKRAGVSDDADDATTVESPLTTAGALVGTLPYMAPEQLEGREADERSDVFAFGCVLYEMTTGRRPFPGNDLTSRLSALLRHRPAPLWQLNRGLPRGLDPIAARCLELDPNLRYADAGEVRDELAALMAWPREEGIPELISLCERILILEESRDSWTAFELAAEIEKLAPGDPVVEKLRPEFANPVSFTSDPPGVRVFAAYYGDPETQETDLGCTPISDLSFPRGLARVRLELDDHRTVHDLVWMLGPDVNNATDEESSTWHYQLRTPDELPADMEEVPAGRFPLFMPGLDHLDAEPTGAFLMDRHPVTNRQFSRFLADGGYAREELWPASMREGEVLLAWSEAMARFVDSVGQPGPAGWVMGVCPAGEDDHPVTGISWYEAAAYAAWVGKSLPSLFHWNRAALTVSGAQIVPAANLGGRGTVPVGQTRSINRFGVHDLAGNVREWIFNPVEGTGDRFTLGGGWNDPGYAFVDAYAQPACDRSATNGFRCIIAREAADGTERLRRAIPVPFHDFGAEEPVSDEVFGYFLRQFQYDRLPLANTLVCDREVPTGRWQTHEIDAAYGRQRMQLHLFLPVGGRAPYQTAILFPGSFVLQKRVFDLDEFRRVDFLVRSGRAVLLPVYHGTYERGGQLVSDCPDGSTTYKDHLVKWGKDLGRAVDFVEAHAELDAERLAYYGVSWGGALGAILPAVEPRIKVNILYVAGFCFQRPLPEADQINYVSRVRQPTLMLNGKLDFYFPARTSQEPMFERLGTPAADKKRLTYERGHTVPKTEMIRESLVWLDRYLGRVAPVPRG